MTTAQLPPIGVGYDYSVQVTLPDDALFPAGIALRAEVRDFAGATTLAGTLSTGDGSITRVDDHTIILHLPKTLTANLGNTTAATDLVQTNVTPEHWLGIQIFLPVERPITVPA